MRLQGAPGTLDSTQPALGTVLEPPAEVLPQPCRRCSLSEASPADAHVHRLPLQLCSENLGPGKQLRLPQR